MLIHIRGLNPRPPCPPRLISHITEDEYLFRRGRKGWLFGEGSSEKILMKQREIFCFGRKRSRMTPSVSHERLLERKPHVLVGRSVGQSVWGEILASRLRPCLMTSAVPSLEILRYPGEFSDFCDVTCVLETPIALKTHSLGAYKTRF